eukprot:2853501-Rhodomonas_salina.3
MTHRKAARTARSPSAVDEKGCELKQKENWPVVMVHMVHGSNPIGEEAQDAVNEICDAVMLEVHPDDERVVDKVARCYRNDERGQLGCAIQPHALQLLVAVDNVHGQSAAECNERSRWDKSPRLVLAHGIKLPVKVKGGQQQLAQKVHGRPANHRHNNNERRLLVHPVRCEIRRHDVRAF